MSNTPRGLPLSSSRVEQIFPILTRTQIKRIAVHGHMRTIQPGEELVEQGDSTVPFFVVVSIRFNSKNTLSKEEEKQQQQPQKQLLHAAVQLPSCHIFGMHKSEGMTVMIGEKI